MENEEDEAIEMVVALRVVIVYHDEARYFNPDDVAFLAKEGIESHYDVRSVTVERPD